MNPACQAPSELRADTCRAGLCPPEAGNSLTSALEFLGVEEEAGSVMGSEDTPVPSGLQRRVGTCCVERVPGKDAVFLPSYSEKRRTSCKC
ncbi:UNVERIFIED_CONTAM: hypothetical protein FKN15_016555 [Acipenser sinensis]